MGITTFVNNVKHLLTLSAVTLLLASCGGEVSDEDVKQGIENIIDSFVLDGNKDIDNDTVTNDLDNCPSVNNIDQIDSNNNGVGDACEAIEVFVVEPVDTVVLTANNTPEVLINGYNASIAMFAKGSYVQLSSKDWVENGVGSNFTFKELRRDEWSVYLYDSSRKVSIQLDYHRKKIIFSNATTKFDLYDITSADPADTNGFSASRVVYSAPGKTFGVGGFVQINATTWSESNVDDTFIFTETARDEWSVYLHDAGRNISIQLDLFRKKVVITNSNPSFDIYSIITAVPDKINAFVMREMTNDFTSFLQTGSFEWVETLSDGSQYNYQEYLRDEWSSFLYDATRDAYVQLDLHVGIINYHVGSTDWALYQGVINVFEQPKVIPTTGPIAWYSFDAGTAADASGNGKNLTWQGRVRQDVDGVDAEALYLSGEQSAAVLPDGIVNYLNDFTVSSYVKLDRLDAWSRIFDFGTSTGNYMFLTPSNGTNGKVRFAINDGTGEQIIEGAAPLAGGVNGYNVKVVMHSNNGAYVQLNSKDWVENGLDGNIALKEVNRDEWSVYLFDASRGASIQLDLHRKKVIYSDANQTFDLYNIVTVQPDEINGFAASKVRHSKGGFYNLEPGKWVEDNGTLSFAFNEISRDKWSVYLYDPNRKVSIQLDLFRKEIIYSDTTQTFVLYHISNTRPDNSASNWVHVAVTKEGNVGKLYVNGAVVGSNTNMTLSPADLGNTTRNWIGRSQFSTDPYLKGSVDNFRIYNRALAAKELKNIIGPDPEMITLMGTNVQLTPTQLKAELQANGLTFVDANTYSIESGLGPDECAIFYANANRDDISADAGVLTCSIESENGDIKLTAQLVYGGCDVSRLDQGVGSRCEVGLAKEELRLRLSDNPPIYNDISIAGPTAEECTAISSENTCFGLNANVASASYGFKNGNGTGLGAGVHVGVGAKASGGFQDGVLSGSVSFKLGIGFSIDFSISGDDVLEVINLGEAGWVEAGGEIVAVGDKTAVVFEDFGNEVHDTGGQVIAGLEVAGETVVVIAEDVGRTAEETYGVVGGAVESAAEDAADGLVDTAGTVVKGVDTASKETVKFVGKTANKIEDCFNDFFGCF